MLYALPQPTAPTRAPVGGRACDASGESSTARFQHSGWLSISRRVFDAAPVGVIDCLLHSTRCQSHSTRAPAVLRPRAAWRSGTDPTSQHAVKVSCFETPSLVLGA